MAILRWNPFSALDTFRGEVGRLFDDFSRSVSERGEGASTFYPRVDIKETKNDYIFSAELPGVEKDDVTISLHENTLTIKGEKKSEEKKENDYYYHVERKYGTYRRSFILPTKVNTDNIKAAFKDGILTITLPKKEEAKPKEISITIS